MHDSAAITGLIERQAVSHLLTVPSFYDAILQAAEASGLRTLRAAIVAGDVCPVALWRRHRLSLPGVGIHNEYGPTEAAVWCSAFEDQGAGDALAVVPIGRPIAGVHISVLSDDLCHVRPGIEGEIFIGGGTVADGYLGAPRATAAVFLPDPDGDRGGRRYRSGDRAYLAKDGNLVWMGRLDNQVKIRGHRVECGEIESFLMKVDGVSAACVVPWTSTETQKTMLVAYLVVRPGFKVDLVAVRRRMESILLDFMVPRDFQVLDRLPVDFRGKIDRRRLPPPRTAADARRLADALLARIEGMSEEEVRRLLQERGGKVIEEVRA